MTRQGFQQHRHARLNPERIAVNNAPTDLKSVLTVHPLSRVSIALLTLALTACQQQPAAGAAIPAGSSQALPPPVAGQPLDLPAITRAAGIACPSAVLDANSSQCTLTGPAAALGYTIELHGSCDEDGFFAVGQDTPQTPVHARIPTQADATPDILAAANSWLCVAATARDGQQPRHYYVLGTDPAQLPTCAQDAMCQQAAYTPEIAGWVDADTVEALGMGLEGAGAGTAVPEHLGLVPEGMQLVDHLYHEGHDQLLLILQGPDAQSPRSARLFARDAQGRWELQAENSRIIPCAGCGGLAGDPYAFSRFEHDRLSINIGGGSRQRWGSTYHFRWSADTQQWLVASIERSVIDTHSDEQEQQQLQAGQLGQLTFAQLDPDKLPPAPYIDPQ